MLETIELPGSGRRTTRIGFGGSGLMGGLSERESLRLLETAYDAGIRHFDVAPSYGHGMAERCLGKFLRGKPHAITVTTKYGILPPPQAGLLSLARNVARPLVRRIPALRKQVAHAAASLKTKAPFSSERARSSLEHSLRELGVERLDLWLLHEAAADDLDNSNLLPFLSRAQQQGSIGAFGVGGDRSHLDDLWNRHHDYCRVLQFECSALDSPPELPGAFQIHYRTVSRGQAMLDQQLQREPQLARRWSDALDLDVKNPETLASLLLSAALASNPNGLVLFSSRRPAHIRANARTAGDPVWAARSQLFLQLLGRHSAELR